MNVKYDWVKLRRRFITGDYATVKEFAEKEKIPYALARKHSANWLDEKRTIKRHKENKIIENVLNKQITSASYINERHISVFNKALDMAEHCLEECASEDKINLSRFEKIVDSLQKIQKGQRLALGMDKDSVSNQEDRVASLFEQVKEVFKDEPDGAK